MCRTGHRVQPAPAAAAAAGAVGVDAAAGADAGAAEQGGDCSCRPSIACHTGTLGVAWIRGDSGVVHCNTWGVCFSCTASAYHVWLFRRCVTPNSGDLLELLLLFTHASKAKLVF
jgi:hypothetical protein